MEDPIIVGNQIGQKIIENLKAVPVDDKLNIAKEFKQRKKQYEEFLKEKEKLQLLTDSLDTLDPKKKSQEIEANEQYEKLLEVHSFLPPFDFDPKVVKAVGGFPKIRENLRPQYLKMTSEEKILWVTLGTGLFLTPQMHKCLNIIVELLNYESLGQSPHPHVGGLGGNGKTTLLLLLVAINMPEVRATYNYIPILMATAPGSTRSQVALYHRLLDGFGVSYPAGSRPEALLTRLRKRKRTCKTMVIVIDEIGFLKTQEQKQILLDILNVMNIKLIIAGEDPKTWMSDNSARQGRFKLGHYLEPYTKSELSLLLSFIEMLLPFTSPSNLGIWSIKGEKKGNPILGPASLLYDWTKGTLREVMLIIRIAAEDAIKEGASSLTVRHLQNVAQRLGYTK